jgi:glycosyltransferase involved in cell wall biosynthesis
MFWCGSDVLEARTDFEAGRVDPWITEKIHWAGSPWLAEEVRAMGLNCEYVPSTWVPAIEQIEDLPKKFSVLAYLPDANRVGLYGIDQVLEVARAMPQVDFAIVGLQPGQSLNTPANVTVHGRVSYLTPFYRNATVVWRPARHDGLSFMALEALAHGRHVMWSYPFSGAIHVRDASGGRIELERLYELHQARRLEINRGGAEFISQNFSPETIREGILSRWRKIVEVPIQLAASEHASRI